MKPILAFLAAAILFVANMRGASPEGMSASVSVWPGDSNLFPSIKHGELVYVSVRPLSQRDGQTFGFGSGEYIYRAASGKLILLSGRFERINEMLRHEIGSRPGAVDFLNSQLARLFLSTMGPGGIRIIDKNFVGQSREGTKERTLLERFEREPVAAIAGDTWKLEFHVLNQVRGGIQKWSAAGSLVPFEIRSFTREIVEPEGILGGVIFTGGHAE